MEEPNKNSQNQPDKVKLIFDVMPQGGAAENLPDTVRAIDLPMSPSAGSTSPKATPKMPEEIVSPDAASESVRVAEKSRRRVSMPHLNFKWIIIIVGILVLGVAGYFGYLYYSSLTSSTEEDLLLKKPAVEGTAAMPDEWLNKYFGSADCASAICGSAADPDNDGLTNSQEQKYSTDPNNPDSDFDGLSDSDEVQVYNTDPRVADTDGDKFEDGDEVRNGYSPTLGGSERISSVEKQVIADNTEKYGLHEPTQTFLSLQTLKPVFNGGTASSSPFVLSAPKGGAMVLQENAIRFTYNASSSINLIAAPLELTAAEMPSYLNSLRTVAPSEGKVIYVGQRKIAGLDLQIDENTRSPGEGTHALRAVFSKSGRIYVVYYQAPESKWAESRLLAEVIINSIR
ncbi:MAG: hypothetical protein M1275_00885 [Patescibacteria group bacterium]|nr:hypothetical protein [Patescibacteria group bacterium]